MDPVWEGVKAVALGKRRKLRKHRRATDQVLRELLLPAGITTLVLLGAVILSASGFVNRGLEHLETREAHQDLDYASSAMDFETKLLARNVQDYGEWTATYEFVQGKKPDFITEDIGAGLENLELNLLVIGQSPPRLQPQFLFTQFRMPGQQAIAPLSPSLEQALRQLLQQWQTQHGSLQERRLQGLISLGTQPILIATNPILPTYGGQPPIGFLLMGRVISQSELRKWAESRNGYFKLESLQGQALTPALRQHMQGLRSTAGGIQMHAIDNNTLVADQILYDILNRPAFILTSQSDREILRMQSQGLFYLYLVMAAAGGAFVLVFIRLASRVARYTLLRNHSQEMLRARKEFAQTTLASLHEGVIVTDERQRIRSLNHTAEQLTGWSQRSAYGRPLGEVYCTEPLDVPTSATPTDPEGRSLLPGNQRLHHRDGRCFTVEESIAPIHLKNGNLQGRVIVIRNVEELRTAAQRLAWMARHDLLTGLLNRCEFEKTLQAAIEDAQEREVVHSLCYFDLDHFRSVNDSCGSEAGDQALIRVAAVIRSCLTYESAHVGRVGNDEFAILFYQLPLHRTRRLAAQIRELVRQFKFSYDDQQLTLDLSYGVVPIRGVETASDVLSDADAACFTQRQSGLLPLDSNQNDLLQARREDLRWVVRIKQALQDHRFLLYQQPIVPLQSGPDRPLLREILIRMVDSEGQIVPAGEFISVVTRHNLAGLVDRWVVSQFIQWYSHQLIEDQDKLGKTLACRYCLNLFPQTISDRSFETFLETQLRDHPIDPQNICFEITESAEIPDLLLAARAINRLRRMGFRFALDDFGKGTSSFGYLKQLPVDHLKIDGAFIKDLLCNPLDEAIVASLVQITRQMGIQTIAEYVHSEELVQRLMGLGVDYAQGFYLAEPQPLDAIADTPCLWGVDWLAIPPILPSTIGQGDNAS